MLIEAVAACSSTLIKLMVQDTAFGADRMFCLIHATRRQFKKCKTFVSIDPLNKIAADNKMFPVGVFLING